MDHLQQLLAAKPASRKERKSWLDEPRKLQRQMTPAALKRILGRKSDVKKRRMRTQQTGQRSSGCKIDGDEENSNDIGAAAYFPRTLVTRRSRMRQITVALKRAGAIPMSMEDQRCSAQVLQRKLHNHCHQGADEKEDKDGRSLLEDVEELHFQSRSSASTHRASSGAWSQGAQATTWLLACSTGAGD